MDAQTPGAPPAAPKPLPKLLAALRAFLKDTRMRRRAAPAAAPRISCQCCREGLPAACLSQCPRCLAVLCPHCYGVHEAGAARPHVCVTCPMKGEEADAARDATQEGARLGTITAAPSRKRA